jgi:predicted RNA-binding Zn ribbon-like protein
VSKELTAALPSIGQAPGDLALVQAFVNTLDIEQSTDELGSAEALASWLTTAGLLEARRLVKVAQAHDLEVALGLREAFRGVLRSHALHAPPSSSRRAWATGRAQSPRPDGATDDSARDLRRIAASLPTRLEVSADGQIRSVAAGSGPQTALTRLLLIAAESATQGTWTRLKACSADDCQWAFYDRSPTRNGCWCSMQICGSRAKSRAYRQRARTSTGARAGSSRPATSARTSTGARPASTTASRSGRTAVPGA